MTKAEISAELKRFTSFAKAKGMNLDGDAQVFKNPKTAKAWTEWLQAAKARA